jgi:uncharacterized protein with NRDE domain
VLARGSEYAGFNLLVGDALGAIHCSNRADALNRLGKGIYGLSNHLLDTPWPKLVRGKARFSQAVSDQPSLDLDALFHLLGDRKQARTEELPDTGVGLETERFLSSAFIAVEGYGTRSSTVLAIGLDGQAELTEREFLQPSTGVRQPDLYEARSHRFSLTARPPEPDRYPR